MTGNGTSGRDAVTDPDRGVLRGETIARRFVSPDGMVVLVGRNAVANDLLTFKLAGQRDFWLHIAAGSGSHVIVRNPDGFDRLPRETERFAASLAAYHSKAKAGGKVAVHVTRCADVTKPRGARTGTVTLRRHTTVRAVPYPGQA